MTDDVVDAHVGIPPPLLPPTPPGEPPLCASLHATDWRHIPVPFTVQQTSLESLQSEVVLHGGWLSTMSGALAQFRFEHV